MAKARPTPSRRTLLQLAPAALVYALGLRRALAEPLQAEIFAGLRRMSALAVELRRGAITPQVWQVQMAELVAGLDVDEVMRAIDGPRLAATLELPEDRALVRGLGFAALDEALARAGVHTKLFALGTGRAIVPHGHHDLVSMHWVLHGTLHGRHYDRLEQTRESLRMRPSIDRILRPGDATSVSDHRDNVHWFVAVQGPVFTFDVLLSRLTGEGPSGRVYVDPRAAIHEGDDVLRAPILGAHEARRRYGRG